MDYASRFAPSGTLTIVWWIKLKVIQLNLDMFIYLFSLIWCNGSMNKLTILGSRNLYYSSGASSGAFMVCSDIDEAGERIFTMHCTLF
jgi:hypothetical protein